jgi:NAD(P)-dependent dehydrogenase (short-subunit alcohol dehydrogenase family)
MGARMKPWTTENIGPQSGKTVLITDGTSRSGLETAKQLCTHGARVVLCSDDIFQAERAINLIHLHCPEGKINYEHVDLGDLNSVIEFTERFKEIYGELNILINNAELKYSHERMISHQGHELMWTFNYLSHFLLTAKLFPLLVHEKEGRIIFHSELNHRSDQIDFYDLESKLYYRPRKAYGQSKLALLIFARELDRRLRAIHLNIKSIPIHLGGPSRAFLKNMLHLKFNHSELEAAIPMLFAATADEATSGHYYGPSSLYQVWGLPQEKDFSIQAKNLLVAEQLWNITEEMTGIEFRLHDLSNVVRFRNKELGHNEYFN